jgi:hypothetical protein
MRTVGICIPAPAPAPPDPTPGEWLAVCPGCNRELLEYRQTGLRPHLTNPDDAAALVCEHSGAKTR